MGCEHHESMRECVEDLCAAGTTWRGVRPVGGFTTTEFYKNYTLSYTELLLMLGTTIDDTLERRLSFRKRVTGSVTNYIDQLVHYGSQLSTGSWRMVQRWNANKGA